MTSKPANRNSNPLRAFLSGQRDALRWCARRVAALDRPGRTKLLGLFLFLAAGVLLLHLRGNMVTPAEFGHSAFRWMAGRWGDRVAYGGVDYSHGWLIPLVSLGLVWRRRRRLVAAAGGVAPAGLGLVAAALLLHVAGLRVAQTRLSLIGLALYLWAVPLFLYGRRLARELLFPCAYLLFCIPLNFLNWLAFPLRLLASRVATALLNGLGIAAVRSGSRIFSTAGQGFDFNVADPCSGLRSLLAIAALTAVYACLTQRGWLRQWTLFLSAIPLAVAGNVVRIVVVAIVAQGFGREIASGVYHDYSGYIVFGFVVLGMTAVGRALQGRSASTPARPRTPAGGAT